jgi:hypothetical protein
MFSKPPNLQRKNVIKPKQGGEMLPHFPPKAHLE